MQYWLLKTEPETFSWDHLARDGQATWDGVRNYQARNNLRKMTRGDLALIYHSVKNPAIVGLAEIVRTHFPDPTATTGDWSAVEVKPVRQLATAIPLKQIKATPGLADMVLVKNSRLSVQPVTNEQFRIITEGLSP